MIWRSRPSPWIAALGTSLFCLALAVQALELSSHWLFSWQRELACAVIVVIGAWGLGRQVLAWAFHRVFPEEMREYIALAVGAGLLIMAVFLLGLGGLLRAPLLYILVVSALGVAFMTLYGSATDGAGAPEGGGADPKGLGRTVTGALGLIVVVLPLSFGFLYASLPPVFFDTMVYHIGLPNLYLSTGRLTHWNGNSIASYPQNAEMLNVLWLSLGGEKAVQIGGFLIAAVCALAVRGFARSGFGPIGGALCFLFLVCQWPFWFGACFGKSDLLGAFFLVTALWVLLEARGSGLERRFVLAGGLAGLAAGVKFSNFIPALLLCLIPLVLPGARLPLRLRRCVMVGLIALLAASPWLVRNTVHRGNPVFPALYSLLGGHDWSADNAARMAHQTGQNLDRSLPAVAGRVLRIGLDHESYGSGGELSPFFLPLLVGALVLCRRRRIVLALLVGGVTLAIGVGLVSSYLRVYAIGWVIASLAAGALYDRFRTTLSRVAVLMVLSTAILLGFAQSIRMCEMVSGGGMSVVTGRTTPESYLVSYVNYYPMAQIINETVPEDARILVVGSSRTAYIHRRCDAPYVWDDARIARATEAGVTPESVLADLEAEGYTHILLNGWELSSSEPSRELLRITGRTEQERLNRLFGLLEPIAAAGDCYLFAL
jgi:hypothetical protein